jgi:hypothetical protein
MAVTFRIEAEQSTSPAAFADESIALLANPFAFRVADGLSGGAAWVKKLPATPFCFPDGDCSGVLDAYGHLVLQELSADLRGNAIVSAIGYTHRDFDPIDADPLHYPKTVGHYWEGYDRNAGSGTYRPPTLIERIRQAKRNLVKGDTAHHSVEEVARGFSTW